MFKIQKGSSEGTRKTMKERICERAEFKVWSERPMEWQMVRAKMETVLRWCAQDEVNQEEGEHELTERRRKPIPQVRWCMSKRAVGEL